jgi:DNA-binding MarR family transcriptional regulator
VGGKAFRSLEDQAFVTLERTADHLLQRLAELVKPAGLSPPQFSVLRILRAARPQGLACREVAERMITRDPDITRLLDRLEDRGLVGRTRERADRRVITVRVTEEGLRTLASLDRALRALQTRQFRHLGRDGLASLIDLLERVEAARE